jgi:glycosyltransferase involved in cell wall biosynthesis
VIAPSQYLKSIITSWGIRGEQVEVIYSVSVVEPPTKTASPALIEGLALSHKRPIILSVARLVPWKGFLVLLDVIAELKTRYPDILLLIGGDGPQFATLEKQIHSLGLEAHVRLLGRLSRPALEELSQHVDMFVLNTEYEGFSHLLAEYMQLGVPIITTKVGGNPELITDQVSGMLVDYNDQPALATAISELTENETLRQNIITGATKRATEFTPEKSLDRLRAVLEAVVKKSV